MFTPDYRNLAEAALNRRPARIPLYEHSISVQIMERIGGEKFAELIGGGPGDRGEFFRRYCRFFAEAGYDAVSFEASARMVMPGSGALGGHREGVIKTRADFEAYPWDAVPDLYFQRYAGQFRALGEALTPGLKAVGGVGNGVFECVQDVVGFQELCYIKADDQELYRDLFARAGEMLARIWERFLAEFGELYCVCRFGDDLGFRSSTLITPEDIRELVIPPYRRIIDLVHRRGKPFLLHSCGCIFEVMEGLIGAGIDAKHSNEDAIAPFSRWIDEYGGRIGNFGGIDTDALCDSNGADVGAYTEGVYRLCEAKGRGAAIGSGNSIPDYVNPERYTLMLDTVRRLRGD